MKEKKICTKSVGGNRTKSAKPMIIKNRIKKESKVMLFWNILYALYLTQTLDLVEHFKQKIK